MICHSGSPSSVTNLLCDIRQVILTLHSSLSCLFGLTSSSSETVSDLAFSPKQPKLSGKFIISAIRVKLSYYLY